MVPALSGLLLTPLLLYKLFPPTIKDTPEAPKVGTAAAPVLGLLPVGGWLGRRSTSLRPAGNQAVATGDMLQAPVALR